MSIDYFYPICAVFMLVDFSRQTDLFMKQISLFSGSFIVFVTLSEVLFGKDFSSKSLINGVSVSDVALPLIIFYFSLQFSFLQKNNKRLQVPNDGLGTTNSLLIYVIPLIFFYTYYVYNNGFRLTGGFVEYRGVRSTLTDYIFVYFVALMSIYRRSRLLLILGVSFSFFHVLSAERMRAFVYIIVLLTNYFDLARRRKLSTILLLVGFVGATVIGELRTGGATGNSAYNVTHFGSVTVSSIYLIDFASTLSLIERIKFAVGIILGNFIPSSMLSGDYNIRGAIFAYADIPGGGWFPVFLVVTVGYISMILTGIFITQSYLRMKYVISKSNFYQVPCYCFILIFISTLPRWFMYTPFQILKMPLYGFLLVIIFKLLTILTRKEKNDRLFTAAT